MAPPVDQHRVADPSSKSLDLERLDAFDPPPPVNPGKAPGARTWIGLGVVALVAVAIAFPIERLRGAPLPTEAVDSRGSASAAQQDAVDSLGIAASLASAAGALAEIESLRKAPPANSELERRPGLFPPRPSEKLAAPAPTSFESPTACMATYLPGVDLENRSLDFVCRETEMWGVEWRVHAKIVPRGGEGAGTWKRLGRHTLGALATMRAGCCEGAEPLLAVVPGLWCGILRDKLRALGPIPEEEPIVDYGNTMACLDDRGVKFPDRWRVDDEAERKAMRAFIESAWRRASRD